MNTGIFYLILIKFLFQKNLRSFVLAWIRIRIDQKCWIRIRIKSIRIHNTDVFCIKYISVVVRVLVAYEEK
jgi:hypothetical protein